MPPLAALVKTEPVPGNAAELYLDLMKKTVTRAIVATEYERHFFQPTKGLYRSLYSIVRRLLATRGLELVRLKSSDPEEYLESGSEATNRVEDAETMIGTRQLRRFAGGRRLAGRRIHLHARRAGSLRR
jgi:hypothetical protein